MNAFTQLAATSEYQALLDTSVRIGSLPLYVQGPGGNTSIKQGNAMWIKASGTWLAEAREKEIMVPVRLDGLLHAIAQGDPTAEAALDFVQDADNPSKLRPSIETTVHAVIPAPVVLHDHCVETIALATRQDAMSETARLLGDLGAVFVPYTKPGLNLAKSISGAISPDTRVIVLGNHGLVVAGDTVAAAEALLVEVASRLAGRLKKAHDPAPDLAELAGQLSYAPAESPYTHAVAIDPTRLAIAAKGSYYPDHVIFLGPGVVVVHSEQSVADVVKSTAEERGAEPVLLLVEGKGALVHKSASKAALALVQCLGDVLARMDPGADLVTLSTDQNYELLNWDAEKYRQSLDVS